MFIFPRVRYHKRLVDGIPAGCIGASHKSGWMTKENFLVFLQHVVKHCKSTVEKPVLLLLDNHESHLSVEGIQFAKDHGVHLLSLCSLRIIVGEFDIVFLVYFCALLMWCYRLLIADVTVSGLCSIVWTWQHVWEIQSCASTCPGYCINMPRTRAYWYITTEIVSNLTANLFTCTVPNLLFLYVR